MNQTLSQSVPAGIVTSVSGYTKLFIGELIERARDVQTEWLAASSLAPKDGFVSKPAKPAGQVKDSSLSSKVSSNGLRTPQDTQEATQSSFGTQGGDGAGATRRFDVKEMDKGPLLPDHLREALRRYKRDREGGSTGFQGLSLFGKANTASRVGGKRLFK